MLSMVMAVSGRDTGAMLYGPSDMQISANTQVKTIEGCVRHVEPGPFSLPCHGIPHTHTPAASVTLDGML